MALYKYLLFDADNTLLDFNRAESDALRATLSRCPLGYTQEIYDRYHEINEGEWKRLEKGETTRERLRTERFEKLYNEHGFDGAALAERTADVYVGELGRFHYLIPGAMECVESLYGRYRMYIVTNGTASVQRSRLALCGLMKFFDGGYISEDIGASKPDKAFFDAVINDIGDSDRKGYLVIGDSPSSDIAGAVASGLDSCLVNSHFQEYGNCGATYTVRGLEELSRIL